MPRTGKKKSARLDSLHSLLADRVRAHKDDPDGAVSPDEVFRQFVVSGLDRRGQLSTGYAEHGKSVTLSADFDFGDMVAPGVLTLELSGEFKGASYSHALVGIQHQGSASLERDPATRMAHAVQMFTMSGKHRSATITFGLEAGVGIPSPLSSAADLIKQVGPDTVAASLEASATAAAEVSYEGDYLFVRDPSPQFFASGMDPSLRHYFQQRLGPESKVQLRQRIGEWLKTTARIKVKRRRHKMFGSKYYNTDDLLAGLQAAIQAHPRNRTMVQTAQTFRDRLKGVRTALDQVPPDPPPANTPYDTLTFLSLWGHKGGAGASAGAKLEAGLEAGNNAAGLSAEVKGAVAGTLKNTSYRLQTWGITTSGHAVVATQDTVITYRQADLSAVAAATAELAYDFTTIGGPQHDHEWEAEWSKAKSYNQMTYRSSIVFWNYAAAHASPLAVAPLLGSGICYGISVLFVRLIQAAHHVTGRDLHEKDDRNAKLKKKVEHFLTTTAWRLRVNRSDLDSFLAASIFAVLEPEDALELPADVVLLEASFALPTGVGVKGRINKRGAVSLGKNVLSSMHKAMQKKVKVARPTPMAIHARYRIADERANEETAFKLGVSFVVGAGIEINSVENAGHEGIVSLATQYYGPLSIYNRPQVQDKGRRNEQQPDLHTAEDQCVPPVALVHQ